jgi:ribosomal protein S14
MHIYKLTNIHSMDPCVTCGTSHKYTTIRNFFICRLKGVDFALTILRILGLDGKLLKILMPA